MSWQETISQLVRDAEMSIGFVQGTGLGAVLLAIVVIVFLLGRRSGTPGLVELIKAARPVRTSLEEDKQVKSPSHADKPHELVQDQPVN